MEEHLLLLQPLLWLVGGSIPQNTTVAIHQKLDGLMGFIMDNKNLLVEAKTEAVTLKSRVDVLGAELTELKQKIESAPTAATLKKRIPRDLSVKLM